MKVVKIIKFIVSKISFRVAGSYSFNGTSSEQCI